MIDLNTRVSYFYQDQPLSITEFDSEFCLIRCRSRDFFADLLKDFGCGFWICLETQKHFGPSYYEGFNSSSGLGRSHCR